VLQAGNDSGLEVTVGGLANVSSLSDSSGAHGGRDDSILSAIQAK
jgi:hypothetical protein